MRRRAVAGLVAVLVAAGLGACGNGGGGTGLGEDADGRPVLPAAGGGGGDSSASAAMVVEDGDARSMIAPARAIEFRLAEGAEAPTSAPAYRIVPDDREAIVRRVAEALDVETGAVEVFGPAWYMARGGDASVSSDIAAACEEGAACPDPVEPPPPEGVPLPADAEAKARRVFERIGIDIDAGTLEVEDNGGRAYQRTVRFVPSVGGLEVQGVEISISFGAHSRVEFATGLVGSFEKLGDYPLLGLEEAFRRYQEGVAAASDLPAGSGMATDAGAAPGGGTSGSTGSAGATEPGVAVDPAPPSDEPPVASTEPQIIELTGAEVALTAVYPRCEDDDFFLVPVFQLLPADIGFSLPAVEDGSTAEPDTSDEVEPCPGEEDPDDPVGKPEPAPAPPDAGGREPASP